MFFTPVFSRIPKRVCRHPFPLSLRQHSHLPRLPSGGWVWGHFSLSPQTQLPWWWMPSWKGQFRHFKSLSLLRQIGRFRNCVSRDYLLLAFPVVVSFASKLLFFRLYLLVFCFFLLVERDWLKQSGRTHL